MYDPTASTTPIGVASYFSTETVQAVLAAVAEGRQKGKAALWPILLVHDDRRGKALYEGPERMSRDVHMDIQVALDKASKALESAVADRQGRGHIAAQVEAWAKAQVDEAIEAIEA